MRSLRVRAADLGRLDWDALRGVHTALHLEQLIVHIEWDWLRPKHGETRTDPRREPAVAV
jgi:hypothetical protein